MRARQMEEMQMKEMVAHGAAWRRALTGLRRWR
jgi:hypothetical protein